MILYGTFEVLYGTFEVPFFRMHNAKVWDAPIYRGVSTADHHFIWNDSIFQRTNYQLSTAIVWRKQDIIPVYWLWFACDFIVVLLWFYYDLVVIAPIIRVLVCFLSATHEGLTPFYCDLHRLFFWYLRTIRTENRDSTGKCFDISIIQWANSSSLGKIDFPCRIHSLFTITDQSVGKALLSGYRASCTCKRAVY